MYPFFACQSKTAKTEHNSPYVCQGPKDVSCDWTNRNHDPVPLLSIPQNQYIHFGRIMHPSADANEAFLITVSIVLMKRVIALCPATECR